MLNVNYEFESCLLKYHYVAQSCIVTEALGSFPGVKNDHHYLPRLDTVKFFLPEFNLLLDIGRHVVVGFLALVGRVESLLLLNPLGSTQSK